MDRLQVLRRYLPLAALAVIQLLIVATVPSKAPTTVAAGGPGVIGDGPTTDFPIDGPDGVAIVGDPNNPDGSGSGSGVTGPGGSISPSGTQPDGSPSPTQPDGSPTPTTPTQQGPTGDTSHCVNGRQADPSIYYGVPPCVGKFTGNNGGATYLRGVTATEIKVVVYRGNLGAAVDAILSAQGANPSDQEFDAFMNAAFKWINDSYELYGRKFKVVRVNGECPSVPPDYACLRNEARQIVEQHKPFAFIWNTSLASPFFDTFSENRVVNLGGWGFRDQFSQLRRPYHYDVPMGGSQLVAMVAEWYCKRMHGNGTAKAEHAGDANIRNRVRVLGVISTDDPENKLAIDELQNHLQQRCGASISHRYFYAQDITTAEQQKRAAVNKMRESPESTTVMCFCDLVAPTFLYQESQEQAYFPEHVMVATGFMDADASAQAYGGLPSTNDNDPRGYNFDYAFGLGQLPQQEPRGADIAARVSKKGGGPATPYSSSYRDLEYYAMLGALVQGAGPNLTPENIEAGASRMLAVTPPTAADPRLNFRGVNPAGDYTWYDSLREIYWSTKKKSPFNGENGTWVSLNNGRQYRPGEFPTGLIKVPKVPR